MLKSESAQRCLRPFGAAEDIAPHDMTSSKCEIVPMRDVLWHSCLRKARWDVGVGTGGYRPPGIAAFHSANAQAVHGCLMELRWASTCVSYRVASGWHDR